MKEHWIGILFAAWTLLLVALVVVLVVRSS